MDEIQSYITSQATKKFIYGFVIGQLIFLITLIFIIKFWFLSEVEIKKSGISDNLRKDLEKKIQLEKNTKRNRIISMTIADAEILFKTLKGVKEFKKESCNWINIIINQIIHRYRGDSKFIKELVDVITKKLNSSEIPEFIGGITINDINFGQEFPKLIFAEIKNEVSLSRLYTQIAIEYIDKIFISLDTSLLIGYKGINFSSLPISLVLNFSSFSGNLILEIEGNLNNPNFFISFSPDVQLDISVSSLIGHKTKLKDVKKISNLIIYAIKTHFYENMVYPNGKRIKLKSFLEYLATN